MSKEKSLELESLVLLKLKGKMLLLHTQEERSAFALTALEEVLKEEHRFTSEFPSANEKKGFIKHFLSYGIIEDLLCDVEVEDVIINSLKPIYIHHAQKGFIATDRHFSSHKELSIFIQKLLM